MYTLPPDGTDGFAQALDELPVFPLPQTVLFPGALLPLHVFEPRYRTMVRDCLEGHKAIAVALIRDDPRSPHGPVFERVAGVGLIIDSVRLADGRYNILLQGRARVRLDELPFVPPYRRAKAAIVRCEPGAPSGCDVRALLASATAFASDIRARDPDFDFQIPPHASPAQVADLAAHHLVVDARERQTLLETQDVPTRVRRTAEALALQHAAMQRVAGRAKN